MLEEARVVVADVAVVGSQPWPIGRYGSCELMLGCIAQATSYEIITNTQEVRRAGAVPGGVVRVREAGGGLQLLHAAFAYPQALCAALVCRSFPCKCVALLCCSAACRWPLA